MSKYISITFGPITRAIGLAESTKELWAASYFFSYLAKRIVEPLARKGQPVDRKREFLIPFLENDNIWLPHLGVGLFPDRYIFKSENDDPENGDFTFLQGHVDDVLKDIAKNIYFISPKNKTISELVETDKIFNYLKSYLKIYDFEKSFDDTTPAREIVSECERFLNLIEMQDTFPESEDINYLHQLFKNVNGAPKKENGNIVGFNGSFLSKDAFGDTTEGKRLFESILEISATEKLDDDLWSMIVSQDYELETNISEEEIVKNLLPYHKYIAIIKADGDDLGRTIATLEGNGVKKLSEAFYNFNIDVINKINDYGGKAVFIGGDDLFILAPVYCNGKNIFELIDSVDKSFYNNFSNTLPPDTLIPTLSFSISMSYYKFPLFEAVENAGFLLENTAKCNEVKSKLRNLLMSKNVEKKAIEALIPIIWGDNTHDSEVKWPRVVDEIVSLRGKKNNLAFSIQKHSGQIISALIKKDHKASYSLFQQLIKTYIKVEQTPIKEDDNKKNNFLSSVMHKLREYEPMFRVILNDEKNKDLLKNFFDNSFNESVHEQFKGLTKSIQELLLASYTDYKNSFQAYQTCIETMKDNHIITNDEFETLQIDYVKEAVNQVYSALRFIHFINAKNNE